MIFRNKVIFCGESASGKTTVIEKYEGTYMNTPPATVGVSFHCVKNKNRYYDIWDCCGSEHFQAIINVYFKKADRIYIFIRGDTVNYDEVAQNYFNRIEKYQTINPEVHVVLTYTNNEDLANADMKVSDYLKGVSSVLYVNINDNESVRNFIDNFVTYSPEMEYVDNTKITFGKFPIERSESGDDKDEKEELSDTELAKLIYYQMSPRRQDCCILS